MSIELGHEDRALPHASLPELETAVYRIVQEALTNATKHGNAKRAVVEIREPRRSVHLVVRDDGDGFDPQAKTGASVCWACASASLLGGELEVNSTPGAGTTVRATVPAERREEEASPSLRAV